MGLRLLLYVTVIVLMLVSITWFILGIGVSSNYNSLDHLNSTITNIDCVTKLNQWYGNYTRVYEETYTNSREEVRIFIDNISELLEGLKASRVVEKYSETKSLVREAEEVLEEARKHLATDNIVEAFRNARISLTLLQTVESIVDYSNASVNSIVGDLDDRIRSLRREADEIAKRLVERYLHIDDEKVTVDWVVVEAFIEHRLQDILRELENYADTVSRIKDSLPTGNRDSRLILARISGELLRLELELRDLEQYLNEIIGFSSSSHEYIDLEKLYRELYTRIVELNNSIKPVLKGDLGRFYNESQSTISYAIGMYGEGYKALAIVSGIRGYAMLEAVRKLSSDPQASLNPLDYNNWRAPLDRVLHAKKLVLEALKPRDDASREYNALLYVVVKPLVYDTLFADELVNRAIEYNITDGSGRIIVDNFAYLLYMRTYYALTATKSLLDDLLLE